MRSATKYHVDSDQIIAAFKKANLGVVSNIQSLDAGEFNTAYFVTADCKDYVIKIAPNSTDHVLTYEKDLMAQEVAFYRLIAENTTICIPQVYYYDDSKSIISSPYFIMERLHSRPLTDCRLSPQEKDKVYRKVGEAVAELGTITGQQFGYEQNGLHDNWYLAIRAMVDNLCLDCARFGRSAKYGQRLLKSIDKHRMILEKVPCCYVHFDIWDGNIFYDDNDGGIAIIDTERGFWGDPLAEFVSIEMFVELSKKQSVAAYNKIATTPIIFSQEELIRFAILKGYLGLIVYTEKFARYKKWQVKYLVNFLLAKSFFNKAFDVLEK